MFWSLSIWWVFKENSQEIHVGALDNSRYKWFHFKGLFSWLLMVFFKTCFFWKAKENALFAKCYFYFTVKLRKWAPGLKLFKGPFFKGLIFGGASIRRGFSLEGNLHFQIDWASLILGSKFTVFALFYFVFQAIFSST